jgi:site-specific DNA recombinase
MVCALYLRVSTKGQEKDGFSLKTQLDEGVAFAASRGWEFQIYQEAESGGTIEDRSQFERLLEDIRTKKVQKIWVIHQDRLNRSAEDAPRLQKAVRKADAELFMRGVYQDFKTPAGRFQYNSMAASSEFVKDHIIETSITGKAEWQNQGLMALPNVFGYTYTYRQDGSKDWKADEKEAKVVKLIYKLFTEDKLPLNQIMLKLNDAGYKTKKGHMWQRSQIKAILSQTLYYGKSWKTDGTLRDSLVYTEHIVSEELFQKAQQVMSTLSFKRNGFLQRKASFELTGFIKCELCGAPYFYNHQLKKLADGSVKEWERYYHSKHKTTFKTCPQKVKGLPREKTELLIANLVRDEFFENDDKFWKWWKSYQSKTGLQIDSLKSAIQTYQAKYSAVEVKRDRVIGAIGEGTLPREDAKNVLAKYSEELSNLQVEIFKLKLELKQQEESINDEVYKAISDLTHNFNNLSVLQKRSLYKTIFKSMRLRGQRLTITLYDGSVRKVLVEGFGTRGHRREKL